MKIVLIIFLSNFLYARSVHQFFDAKSLLREHTTKQLVDYINELVKVSAPSRMLGLPGHSKAQEYILSVVRKNDPQISGKLIQSSYDFPVQEMKNFYTEDFNQKIKSKLAPSHPEYAKWQRFTDYMVAYADTLAQEKITNIVWQKEGLNSNKTLVIVAHYDTASHDPKTLTINKNEPMPGANYNASGVSVALSLVKVLAQLKLNYNVQVVFLDSQAFGFLGSKLHADELAKSKQEIMGVFNLEMLGQDSTYFDKTKQKGNLKLYYRPVDREERLARRVLDLGGKFSQKVQFSGLANNFENSDNFRYWEKDFNTLTFTQDWENDFNPKFYQTKLDTPETLNHETLYESFLYIGGTCLSILLDLTK